MTAVTRIGDSLVLVVSGMVVVVVSAIHPAKGGKKFMFMLTAKNKTLTLTNGTTDFAQNPGQPICDIRTIEAAYQNSDNSLLQALPFNRIREPVVNMWQKLGHMGIDAMNTIQNRIKCGQNKGCCVPISHVSTNVIGKRGTQSLESVTHLCW